MSISGGLGAGWGGRTGLGAREGRGWGGEGGRGWRAGGRPGREGRQGEDVTPLLTRARSPPIEIIEIEPISIISNILGPPELK